MAKKSDMTDIKRSLAPGKPVTSVHHMSASSLHGNTTIITQPTASRPMGTNVSGAGEQVDAKQRAETTTHTMSCTMTSSALTTSPAASTSTDLGTSIRTRRPLEPIDASKVEESITPRAEFEITVDTTKLTIHVYSHDITRVRASGLIIASQGENTDNIKQILAAQWNELEEKISKTKNEEVNMVNVNHLHPTVVHVKLPEGKPIRETLKTTLVKCQQTKGMATILMPVTKIGLFGLPIDNPWIEIYTALVEYMKDMKKHKAVQIHLVSVDDNEHKSADNIACSFSNIISSFTSDSESCMKVKYSTWNLEHKMERKESVESSTTKGSENSIGNEASDDPEHEVRKNNVTNDNPIPHSEDIQERSPTEVREAWGGISDPDSTSYGAMQQEAYVSSTLHSHPSPATNADEKMMTWSVAGGRSSKSALFTSSPHDSAAGQDTYSNISHSTPVTTLQMMNRVRNSRATDANCRTSVQPCDALASAPNIHTLEAKKKKVPTATLR